MGYPERIHSDNGPEFVSTPLPKWLTSLGTGPLYVGPGSSWETEHWERFKTGPEDLNPGRASHSRGTGLPQV